MKNRALYLCLAAITLFGSALLGRACGESVSVSSPNASYDWYFLHQGEGTQPLPTDQCTFWEEYNAYYIGSPEEKVIYLTFDGGYDNGYTEKILDVLKEENVPAAFFVTGHLVESAPDIMRRMVDEGHLVCNHSANHADLSTASSDKIKSELTELEAIFKEVTGQEMPKYMRPPEGRFSENMLRATDSLGYTNIFWSFAYMDWDNSSQPSHQAAIEKIRSRTHNGMVALLHSTSRTNSEILGEVIKMWKDMGYTFGTLDELTGKKTQEITGIIGAVI